MAKVSLDEPLPTSNKTENDTQHLRVNPTLGKRRISILDRNVLAFAPNHETIESLLDEDTQAHFLKSLETHEPASHLLSRHHRTSTDGQKQKPKPGKIPLPKPYRNHWAEIEGRRAMKHFIYGKDEEYVFSEKDIRVPTPCSGIICFHLIELLDLVVNKQSFAENLPVSYYCLTSIGSTKRCSKIVHARQANQVKLDSHVHLSIDISQIRDAPNNRLRMELWSFQDPEAHFIVGTVEIHIYNIIRTQHNIDWVNLWSDGLKVGKLAYEVAFSYGVFGYGYSNQLKNFAQPIMETISHSMFPRIRLDDKADISDKSFQARKPEKLKLFTYHSLILEVDDKDPWNSPFFRGRTKKPAHIDIEPKPIVVQQVQFENGFPVHCKLHMNIWQKVIQPDFNDMYGEYICIGHKRERLEYLSSMTQGRLRDIFEEEAAPVFEYLKPREIDEIHKTQVAPGEILYPQKIPCPTSEPFTLEPEDQEFQDKFPSVRRETGYLAKMFGYEEKPKPEQCLNDMDYPAYKDIKIEGGEKKKTRSTHFKDWLIEWIVKIWILVKFKSIQLFYYIFPEDGHELPIPEVSLTVATPEGSTTNIYSYFSREYKDPITNKKLARLVQQTTALMGITKKHVQNKNSSDSSDSS